MTDLHYAHIPRLYRHSVKVPPIAWLGALAAAVAAGLVLGAAYGAGGLFAHLLPSAKLILIAEVGGAVLFGMGLGTLPVMVLLHLKGRSSLTGFALVFLSLAIGMYTAWLAYAYCLMRYQGGDIPLSTLALPSVLPRYIAILADNGVWSVDKDIEPKGMALWGIWAAELLVVATSALMAVRKRLIARVFCEQCKTWGEDRHLMRISAADAGRLQTELASGRLDALHTATRANMSDTTWLDLSLEGCATCDSLQTLSLTRTQFLPNKKSRSATKRKVLLNRLLLTPEDAGNVLLTVATLNVPPPVPNAPSVPRQTPPAEPAPPDAPPASPTSPAP